jgi:hypothetical protein
MEAGKANTSKSGKSERTARVLAWIFFCTTLCLSAALVSGWVFVRKLALKPLPEPALPAKMQVGSGPASPLQIQYQLNMPGRGEIFPAFTGAQAADYWPVAVLSVANTSNKAVLQVISAEVKGWSDELRQTAVIGPHEVRTFNLDPALLAKAYDNSEIHPATLVVEVEDPATGHTFAQQRPVLIHSAYDLFWGRKFANAQLLARWVTPHDDKILQLVSHAERLVPGGRLRGYNPAPGVDIAKQVRAQAMAVFNAMRRSGISYVSSIYTFGNYPDETQRIRLPRETLALSNANCIDVSVAFASALENLGMKPVVVIVPGHAFTGVRLGPNSQDILYLDLTVLPRGTFAAAEARAKAWLKKTPSNEVLTVDIGAARSLGIYPMPGPEIEKQAATAAGL